MILLAPYSISMNVFITHIPCYTYYTGMVSLPYGLPYVAGIVTTRTTIDLQDHSNSTVGNITTAQLLTGRGNALNLYGLLIKVFYDKYKFRGKNVCRIEKHIIRYC